MAAQIQKTVSSCVFCSIIAGTSPAVFLRQDEKYVAFQDIRPVSDNHILIVPKEHITNVKCLTANTVHIIDEMVAIGQEVVKNNGGDLSDCRMGFHWPPFNSISHLHLHVIFPESKINFLGRAIYRPKSFYFVSPKDAITWLQKNKPSL